MIVTKDQQASTEFLSKLVFIEKLGKGYYGVVYKVKNRETNELFALKKVKYSYEGVSSTSLREIPLLHLCSHPNIVSFAIFFLFLFNFYLILYLLGKRKFCK